jgi:hypothetical protein
LIIECYFTYSGALELEFVINNLFASSKLLLFSSLFNLSMLMISFFFFDGYFYATSPALALSDYEGFYFSIEAVVPLSSFGEAPS